MQFDLQIQDPYLVVGPDWGGLPESGTLVVQQHSGPSFCQDSGPEHLLEAILLGTVLVRSYVNHYYVVSLLFESCPPQ